MSGPAIEERRSRGPVERIVRAADRMSDMVQKLTEYARVGRGPIPIVPAPMNLGDLCRDVVEDFRLADSAREIALGCAGELQGAWDRNRLYQAISNLLGNALRYGTEHVAIRAQERGAHVEVAVHNAGPPIATELLPVIFRPFERGVNDRRGLGLGLFIVREIAKAHRGDVSVTSSAESGTTFVLELPRAE